MVSRSKDAEKVAAVVWAKPIRKQPSKTSTSRIPFGIRPAIPLVRNHKDNIKVVLFLHAAAPIRKCHFARLPAIVGSPADKP
jgi:hypothetical protein